MLLKDKVAVITGGAGINGLGYATARQMAAQGARVVILDLARAEPATAAARLGEGHLGLVADVTDKAACDDAVLDVSLRGTLYMSQAALPAMRQQRSGSIVCISSVSAQRGGGIFGGPHYSAAKAGVLGLARAMAREFGPDNIRVNCITPGLIETDITAGKLSDAKKAEINSTIPLARLGRADDVAGACVFLASELSAYCTGITLDVNGGMLIH